MNITPTLKVTLLEPAGDVIVVEDMPTGNRWLIGMEDVVPLLRQLNDALAARSGGLAVEVAKGDTRTHLLIPVDGFVLFAGALGFYLGLTWREKETGIVVKDGREFAFDLGLPAHLFGVDGRTLRT